MNLRMINTLLLIGLAGFSTTSCHKDKDDPSPVDETAKKIQATWVVSAVTLTGLDVTSFYAGLTVTFADGGFTCVNPVDPVWPDKDSYTLSTADDRIVIARGDGVDMLVKEITDKTLILEFDWSGATGGRKEGVQGGYHFEFEKQ